MQVFMSAEVLGALAGTLFPKPASSSQDSSGASTPADEVMSWLSSFEKRCKVNDISGVKICRRFQTSTYYRIYIYDIYDQLIESNCIFYSLENVGIGHLLQQEPVLVRSPSKDVGLTNHPAKKFVMDFLRVIVVDSLSLPVTAKSPPAIDLVLEAWPEHASTSQQMRYQTEVLSILMEHLLAADVLIGEQAALPVVPGGSVNNITNNVCYVAARIVDKLWQGNGSAQTRPLIFYLLRRHFVDIYII